jgi:hypothetical protein
MSERTYHNDMHAGLAGTSPKGFNMKKSVERWNIEELEEFFKSAKLPEAPVFLPGTTMKVVDIKKFLDSHINSVKKHNGNKTFRPDFERLLLFKKYIQNG